MNSRLPLLQTIMPPFNQLDAAQLQYPHLQTVVQQRYRQEYEALDNWSDDWLATEALPQKYLLAVALKIQNASTDDERALWSQRFTEVSVRLFGQPKLAAAVAVAAKDIMTLKALWHKHGIDTATVTPLFDAYQRFIGPHPPLHDSAADLQYGALFARINAYLFERFTPVFAVLTDYRDDAILDAATIRRCYRTMLEKLAAQVDPAWQNWRVVASESAQMAVSPGRKEIQVGAYLPPLPMRRVKSLFTHEVLVHAQRSVRGAVYDRRLASGLPGYVIAEEGLGVLMEAAIEGQMPHRAGDRYVDIAMALGLGDRTPLNRHQLYPIVYARTLLRRADEGAPTDHDIIKRASWQHVNRIYRGTLGNEHIGVFTKDVVYYRGYRKMAQYLQRYKEPDVHRAIDFVLSGKINPTDPAHRLYVHDRKFNIIRVT